MEDAMSMNDHRGGDGVSTSPATASASGGRTVSENSGDSGVDLTPGSLLSRMRKVAADTFNNMKATVEQFNLLCHCVREPVGEHLGSKFELVTGEGGVYSVGRDKDLESLSPSETRDFTGLDKRFPVDSPAAHASSRLWPANEVLEENGEQQQLQGASAMQSNAVQGEKILSIRERETGCRLRSEGFEEGVGIGQGPIHCLGDGDCGDEGNERGASRLPPLPELGCCCASPLRSLNSSVSDKAVGLKGKKEESEKSGGLAGRNAKRKTRRRDRDAHAQGHYHQANDTSTPSRAATRGARKTRSNNVQSRIPELNRQLLLGISAYGQEPTESDQDSDEFVSKQFYKNYRRRKEAAQA